MLRDLVRLVGQRPQLRCDGRHVSKEVESDMVPLHSVHGFQQILLQKRHDSGDLCLRALPVFRGKGVDRQVLDADVLAVGGDPAEGLRPRLMPRGARQPPLGGPAAIAVHNNRNMASGLPAHPAVCSVFRVSLIKSPSVPFPCGPAARRSSCCCHPSASEDPFLPASDHPR